MYIRCPECRASTWIDLVPSADAAGGTLTCKSCSRSHAPAKDNALAAGGTDPYQIALNFAEQHGLDLPSAYSVLLGIITLEGARELLRTPSSAPAPTPRARSHAASDPDALTAEALGLGRHGAPTPVIRRSASGNRQGTQINEAPARDRGTVAERLARRYKLAPEQARDVAERRLTLQAALMQQPRETPPKTTRAARRLEWQRLLIPALAFFLAVTLIGVHAWREWRGYVMRGRELESAPLTPVQRDSQAHSTVAASRGSGEAPEEPYVGEPGVDVLLNDLGEITQITAPSAQAVLVNYCSARGSKGQGCDPVELAAPIPAHVGVRIGVFRDYTDLSRTFALRISRDTNSRRWRAGDGLRPIAFIAADQMRLTEPRIPLSHPLPPPAIAASPAPSADAAVRSDAP